MSVSSVGAGAMFALRVAMGAGTPSAQQGQVNSQADLLQSLMASRLPAIAAAHLSSGGVDLYM
jgi:hypothetical protein